MLLEGKNAIVTGGSAGIGAATSLELAREGANVCLTYRKHEAEAKEFAQQIIDMGRKAGQLALRIKRGESPEKIAFQYMEEALLHINLEVAAKQGIVFTETILQRADKIHSQEE